MRIWRLAATLVSERIRDVPRTYRALAPNPDASRTSLAVRSGPSASVSGLRHEWKTTPIAVEQAVAAREHGRTDVAVRLTNWAGRSVDVVHYLAEMDDAMVQCIGDSEGWRGTGQKR